MLLFLIFVKLFSYMKGKKMAITRHDTK